MEIWVFFVENMINIEILCVDTRVPRTRILGENFCTIYQNYCEEYLYLI
jgi:hypothetical protein